MNDMHRPPREERAEKLQGMGCKRKRVEDIRFVQGKGNYVDDLKLPGMLYGDFVRSPYAHARDQEDRHLQGAGAARRARGADRRRAEAAQPRTTCRRSPATCRRCWPRRRCCSRTRRSPSSSPRTAMPPPTPSSWSRSSTRRCRCIVDPFKAMAPDAPVLREDIKDKTDGAHGKRKHYNHIFTWEIGDKRGDRRRLRARPRSTIKELISYQRVHPCPLETCQCVASFDKIKGELTLWGTFQAPARHPHGRLADLEDPRAQDPRHRARHRRRLRQQGRRLSRLYLRDRRLDRDRAGR